MTKTHDIGEPSKWVPMTDARKLAAIGKLCEEANELGCIIARCIIQGLDGCDPDTGQPNLDALRDEIADVRGLSRLVIDELGLDESMIGDRGERKRQMKLKWLKLLGDK